MSNEIFRLTLFVMALISITSCKTEKKYYYVENGREEKTINAHSDSAAYMDAFADFQISKKAYTDMKKSSTNSYLKEPISFALLNDKRENITDKIFFANKDSLEKTYIKSLNELPNYLEQSQTEAENKQVTAIPKQLKDEEYFSFYSSNLDNIKLTKMFDVAPLYGDYAEALNNVLLDMETKDSLFHIFKNIKLKTLHDQRRKIQIKALSDFIKYGNPNDEDHFFIFANSACEIVLEKVLNDPDYEVVKDKYYLKQTGNGYDYKLLIRGKNAFGAKILNEMTFSLQYNPFTKEYVVTKVR